MVLVNNLRQELKCTNGGGFVLGEKGAVNAGNASWQRPSAFYMHRCISIFLTGPGHILTDLVCSTNWKLFLNAKLLIENTCLRWLQLIGLDVWPMSFIGYMGPDPIRRTALFSLV